MPPSEYRIRKALKDHEATFPDQKGKRIQHPTARWVLQYFVGIPLLCQTGHGRWCSILPWNISTCSVSLANLTCGFMTSDIRKTTREMRNVGYM